MGVILSTMTNAFNTAQLIYDDISRNEISVDSSKPGSRHVLEILKNKGKCLNTCMENCIKNNFSPQVITKRKEIICELHSKKSNLIELIHRNYSEIEV